MTATGVETNWLPISVAFIWILLAFDEGVTITAFHTQEGCNATLLCNQPGNVTWLNSVTRQKIEGPRFTTLTFGSFSTLVIAPVSKNDAGNITCLGEERNLTITLEVCSDVVQVQNCLLEIKNRPNAACNDRFMIENCKKSCGLCPDCVETVLPTTPLPTDNTQPGTVSHTTYSTKPTTSANNTQPGTVSHTTYSTKPTTSATTESVSSESSTADLGFRNSGTSWSSGFQGVFAVIFGLFSIVGVLFQNLNNLHADLEID